MSCQRGNVHRSRAQKHQNQTAFKNNLHDKSQRTKFINSIGITDVCERCKNILEWKIKYKKYKMLKAPAKCRKCEEKAIKHSYHTICLPCAKQQEVCPKCGVKYVKEPSLKEKKKEEMKQSLPSDKPLDEHQVTTNMVCLQMLKDLYILHLKDRNKADKSDSSEADTFEHWIATRYETNSKGMEDLSMKLNLLSVEKEEDDSDSD